MGGPENLLLWLVIAIIAVFVLKTIFKIAVRLAVAAVIIVFVILYFTGKLPLPF
ncbi:MAG: hypothetical protein GX200_05005 [Firmicutes bacterium]|nr:hypothetical protein [Bacillota bacterium]